MPSTPPHRWFAVGTADTSEADAGVRAADAALIHDNAKLLVLFCSCSDDLPGLVRQIRSRSGDVPLIGCTTAGEIEQNGPHDGSIVVTALGGDGFAIGTAAAEGASEDLRGAGAHAARCLPSPEDHPHRALMLLTDGLLSDREEILRGAYSVLGAGVPLVGGCAADGLKMTRTFQFHGDRVLTDSVVAAGIASTGPIGIGVRHGWRAAGEPMLVTGSSPDRIESLDGRPALDVFLERLGIGPGDVRPEELPGLAHMHPFGLSRHRGEEQVHVVNSADFAERSLFPSSQVPQGSLLWLMEGDADAVLEATDAACSASLAALGDVPPLGMLAFDCVARRGVLGDQGIKAEIERLASITGGTPLAGFYSYGEIARTHGMRGLYNHTLVVLSVT
ncbi:MAG TPA: FIST N-terminal domain-containing protein [Streptosporangiaceae bacterium]|nr:FIST N-terminal domain-containing protein [Streptosporangiaceae bacterium]